MVSARSSGRVHNYRAPEKRREKAKCMVVGVPGSIYRIGRWGNWVGGRGKKQRKTNENRKSE